MSRPYRSELNTTYSVYYIIFVMRLGTDILTAYGYGYGGFTGTGTSPPSSTYASYGNSSTSYYVPSGTAPYSSYGTVSGAPYKTYNSSDPAYPTHHPTHGPYPIPSGTAVPTKTSGNTTSIASTGDPSAKGTAASTGFASAPSSFGTSGGYTYTAPKGIPTEYFYHHKKPKRNVRLSLVIHPSFPSGGDRYTDG